MAAVVVYVKHPIKREAHEHEGVYAVSNAIPDNNNTTNNDNKATIDDHDATDDGNNAVNNETDAITTNRSESLDNQYVHQDLDQRNSRTP